MYYSDRPLNAALLPTRPDKYAHSTCLLPEMNPLFTYFINYIISVVVLRETSQMIYAPNANAYQSNSQNSSRRGRKFRKKIGKIKNFLEKNNEVYVYWLTNE